MIKTFKNKDLEQCWETGKSKIIKQNILKRILFKLDSMDAATCIEDLQNPPGNNLHKLHGKYDEFWSISVNGPWRLIFKFQNGDIFDLELIQYH